MKPSLTSTVTKEGCSETNDINGKKKKKGDWSSETLTNAERSTPNSELPVQS